MSVSFHLEDFDLDFTLVNGRMSFSWTCRAENVAEFVAFCYENPEHVFEADGMEYTAQDLIRRYISPSGEEGSSMSSVTEGEIGAHVRGLMYR